jgi:hypothetical protein
LRFNVYRPSGEGAIRFSETLNLEH